jgi:hypothetical protein
MRRFLLSITLLLSLYLVNAQSKASDNADTPFFDYENITLSSSADIAGHDSKPQPLRLTGRVFESDGTTPAKNVILYLYQHDEKGEFQYETYNGKKRLKHRGWVQTNENGEYVFNTFVPGEAIIPLNYPRHYGPKQLYLMAKTPDSQVVNLPAFMFEGDDLLSKSCMKRLNRKGIDCILSPVDKNGTLVAEKNIVLPEPSQSL